MRASCPSTTGGGTAWGYDLASTHDVLAEADSRDILRREAFRIAIPNIRELESNHVGRMLESCYVEAVR